MQTTELAETSIDPEVTESEREVVAPSADVIKTAAAPKPAACKTTILFILRSVHWPIPVTRVANGLAPTSPSSPSLNIDYGYSRRYPRLGVPQNKKDCGLQYAPPFHAAADIDYAATQ